MSSQPTNELNEHVCHREENSWVVVFFRFFESGSFFSLFLFFLLVLLSENGDRVSCYFFICFVIQKVPFGVTNLLRGVKRLTQMIFRAHK